MRKNLHIRFFDTITSFLLVARQNKKKKPVFHYSLIDAMRNNVFVGDISVKDLRNKGDFGLGTYNYLDGEMIVLDGIFYRAVTNGDISEIKLECQVPYACITFFAADFEYEIKEVKNIEMLEEQILNKLPSIKKPYALRIECDFESIILGCISRIDPKKNISFDQLLQNRSLYKKENISGTIVGFYNPPSFASIDLSPFHFHFISNDKKYGGHLVSGIFSVLDLKVGIDEKPGYEIILPKQNQEFDKLWLH
jgi:acetolactate decarboxylase